MEMEDQPEERASDLKALAEAKFGKETLSDAEKLLLEKVPNGDFAICGPNRDDSDPSNKPEGADKWGPKRQIRAELVGWLCMDRGAQKRVHWRGIQVYGADITGPLDLSFANIPFPLVFQHCRRMEGTDLSRAEVSELDLTGSLVYGITADSLIVKNNVFLSAGFVAIGEVRLLGARIGANLECNAGTFKNPPQKGSAESGDALSADLINVKGSVFLRKSTACGEVRLPGAQIGGNLDCSGGTLANQTQEGFPASGTALKADRINVKGSVLLNANFTASGEMRLIGAQIGGALDCENGNFQAATLDLRDAAANTIYDPGVKWPGSDKLLLDGFAYGRISTEEQIDVTKRLDWLGRQPSTPFHRRPYLQLANVLRESGDSDGALRVLEKMEGLRRRSDANGPFARPWSWVPRPWSWVLRGWSWVLKWSIGYGYHPGRAIWLIILLSALGWVVYVRSDHARTMVPTEKDAYKNFRWEGQVPPHYPTFSPLVYSVENSLPLVKLGQGDKWQPGPGPPGLSPTWFLGRFATSPQFVTWFLRIQILLGWLLATLFVAGVSGIVHKE